MSKVGVAVKNRDWGRRAFSPARRRAIAAVAEALFSNETVEGLAPAPAALAERVADEFDLLVGAGSTDLHRGFRALAFLVEWLPLFILGQFSRASRLPLARRLAYLHHLEHSKIALIATLFVGFKLPLTMIAFEVGDELGSTGFDRATISTPRRVRKLDVIEEPPTDALPEAAGQGRR
jgi:hypothetical protein